ncbi:hypothetical protein [Methanosarcina siciliae]|uniref:hypothetical protein n=1 Tax=Methanosarcina siciliae TaxID=38027 RepID=UPI000695E337|nr:hypothetical protein [Methanosarcina siciliae]
MIFSRDDSGYVGVSLVELDSRSSSSVWKSMPVKEILSKEKTGTFGEITSNESISANTSNAYHKDTKIKIFPVYLLV